ncbi:hypothetical protein BKA61DRAFT_732603 [Leptodontidium sp. MPI-SDFR-AT-0119]|nr:hypothetical protein BKA61DRAFT_732603 [Leptodontidium sp. MPI-SDFR-AT-0119]
MSSKIFLIIGATGATGIEVTERALHNKQKVVLYVRNPAKLPAHLAADPNVTVHTGTLDDAPSFQKAFNNVATVISLLGPSATSPGPTSQYYPVILRMMRTSGVKRIVSLSTFAVSQSEDRFALSAALTHAIGKVLFPKGMKNFIDTHQILVEDGTDIDWTEVRVGMLKNNAQPGESLSVGYIGAPKFALNIRRKHIAEFMVAEAEKGVADSQWIKKSPAIWTSS